MTLLELLVGMGLMVVVIGTVTQVFYEDLRALREASAELQAANQLLFAAQSIGDSIGSSSPSKITVTTGAQSDSVSFQTVLPDLDANLSWGADETVGYSYNILVSGGQLVRQTLNSGGSEVRRVVLAPDLNTAGASKPFEVSQSGSEYDISIRVIANSLASELERELTTTVAPRNP